MTTMITPTARDSQGYLPAIAGGAAGAALLAAAGTAAGAAMIPILEDPNGGMANLGLILIPLALGALGIVVGMSVGVWAALKRGGHQGAKATAWLTLPLSVVAMFAATNYFPVQIPVVLFGVPALARRLALAAGHKPTTYVAASDSSLPTTSEIGGSDEASWAIEREV